MPETTAKKRGPNTEEGKKRSSLNALKHGLYARVPHALDRALTDAQKEEDELREAMLTPPVTYAEAQERMRACHQPQDPTEDLLVDRMALCTFRLSMFEGMGWLSFSRNQFRSVPSQTLVAAMKAERMALMEFQRCLRALNAKRAAELRLAALKAQAHTESVRVHSSGVIRHAELDSASTLRTSETLKRVQGDELLPVPELLPESESPTPATRHLEPETQNSPDICVHLRSSAVDIPVHPVGQQESIETNYPHEETEHEIVPSEAQESATERFPAGVPVPDSRPLTPHSLRSVRRHLRPGRHNNCSRTTGLPGPLNMITPPGKAPDGGNAL